MNQFERCVTIREHRFVFSVQDIVSMYHLPRVYAPQYSFAESVRLSRFEIVASVVEPTGHLSDISATRADLLYAVSRGYSIDLAHRIWSGIMSYSHHPSGTAGVPYASFISKFYLSQSVQVISSKPALHPPIDIFRESLSRSTARVHLNASDIPVAKCIQPCPLPIEPVFPTIHPIAEEPLHMVSSSFSYGAATPVL
ncbi:hypothetical protein U1Q18_019602 [Sarracenia purpurea var. burkii]